MADHSELLEQVLNVIIDNSKYLQAHADSFEHLLKKIEEFKGNEGNTEKIDAIHQYFVKVKNEAEQADKTYDRKIKEEELSLEKFKIWFQPFGKALTVILLAIIVAVLVKLGFQMGDFLSAIKALK